VLRGITIDRPSIRVGRFEALPRDIELSMVAVIEREVNLQRRLETLKRDLELGLDYTAMAAFRSVDRFNSGVITTVNLGAFLRDNGHFATEGELLAIIRRIDTDGDADVDYAELAEFLRPLGGITTVVREIPTYTTTVVEEPLTTVVETVPRYWADYPYRYWPYSRHYPYYPRYYEPLVYSSPSRVKKTTTYHTPTGPRTYTTYL